MYSICLNFVYSYSLGQKLPTSPQVIKSRAPTLNPKQNHHRDLDSEFGILSVPAQRLKQLKEAVSELEIKEFHELSPANKLTLLSILCDACLDTSEIKKLVERNGFLISFLLSFFIYYFFINNCYY